MSPNTTAGIPVREINGQTLNPDQRSYLNGFFSGLAARGVKFSDVEPLPIPALAQAASPIEELIAEERIKRELHPLDAYPQLLDNALANKPPEKEDIFRFKWNGLFFLSPVKDGYMARLRIPGGFLKSFQLRELASIAKQLTTGYAQITTRANLQLRLIAPKDCPEVLRRIQSVGLHTRGAGADNVRNITANPTAGIDASELIDVMPFCQDLAQMIINDRSFYNLPRKFNVAIDGGGLIGTVEDTNDIGAKAVKVGNEVFFRIALGGATGHKTFARDAGALVKPSELIKVIVALIRVFMANGNRTDRKRARLKHLLESWSLEKYLEETEKLLGWKIQRSPLEPSGAQHPAQKLAHSHIGEHAQKQSGLNYIGVAMPVGQITPKQMVRVAEIADLYGSSEVRLTVWQNFIIPNVADAYVETVKRALRKCGFETGQSMLAGGLIACTGNSYCKFAQTNTKGHAVEIAGYLDKKIVLDSPINIHFTGCPNSCAQHYIGDIGLLGVKVRGGEGYHVFVGGGFGSNQAVGRQIFTGVTVSDLKPTLEKMLRGFLRRREPGETFQSFATRHDLNTLQAIFSNEE
jgi:ferredoxin-nitrite reductase